MNKERTTEERAGFATGVLNILIWHIGWSLFKEESWLTYLGFFLMIFAAVMALKYMMPSKNTKADITLHNSPFKKPNKDEIEDRTADIDEDMPGEFVKIKEDE